MNELFDSLYLGIGRGHDVNIIVDGKTIPITVTNMETERFSYEETMKIKLTGMIRNPFTRNIAGHIVEASNIPFNLIYEKVIFNDPATIVIWKDGSKTVVKCQKDDGFDPEKGLALCFMKKALGNKGNFNNILKSALSSN